MHVEQFHVKVINVGQWDTGPSVWLHNCNQPLFAWQNISEPGNKQVGGYLGQGDKLNINIKQTFLCALIILYI